MSIGILNNSLGTNPYTQTDNRAKTGKTNDEFQKKVMKCTGTATHKAVLYSDALMSYASPQTGESVNIYRAGNYSADNPLYMIKGLDADGNEFEEVIDAGKINPNGCSYNEMMVLNLETGHTSPSDYLHAAVLRDKSEADSYFEQADYIAYAKEVMEDFRTVGSWDSYLAMDKWIQSLLEYTAKNYLNEM